jgi:hypothetical protein
MKQLLFILFVANLVTVQALPQSKHYSQIKGLIKDKDSRQPLADAMVVLLMAKDSSRVVSGFTDANGMFLLGGVREGSYKLYVSFLGYQPVMHPLEVTIADTLVNLGIIPIKGMGMNLKTVEIVSVRAPMVIKRDTLEFNAEYYKTRENAVMEELLRKLPGVQIEKDGTIKVNGQMIKRILIDGKPFFGNDPKLAARNLPADMVDKVQLIDSKSDQGQFTEGGDSKKEKAINITVKKDSKGHYLGKISIGYGTNERFAGNGNINKFSDGEQISFLGGTNNVNNSGFLDGIGMGAGAGGGITRNWNMGLNYSKDINEELKISGSYVIGGNHTENERSSARQNILPDTTFYYNEATYSSDKNTNHAFDLRIEYKPDTMHSLIVAGNFGYGTTENRQESIYESLGDDQQMVNKGSTRIDNTGTNPRGYIIAQFDKKFRKAGRTVQTTLELNHNTNRKEGLNLSHNSFVQLSGNILTDTLDQQNAIKQANNYVSFRILYTEPVFKDCFLEFLYVYNRSKLLSDKYTYDYNTVKGVYDLLNDSLSNSFKNITTFQLAGISLRTQKPKYDYVLGIKMLFNSLDNNNNSHYTRLKQQTANFAPFAFLNYAFTNNNRLQLLYSGATLPPNIMQLQPVPDNSNPLYIKLGNPDLRPAFMHSVIVDYNALNPASMRSFTANVNLMVTRGKIINATWFDSLGRQVSQPQNINGSYNVNANLVNAFPLKKLSTFINLNTVLAFNRDISYVNGTKGSMENLNISQALTFNYTHKDLFDLSTAVTANYNGVRYTLQKDNNINYFNYHFYFNCNINLPLGFHIGGNIDYMLNAGRAAGYNQDVVILNSFVSKNLFRHQQGLLKLQGFDLLNRNLSITRNVGESYVEDVRMKVLQRFFMLSFSYFFKRTNGNQ